MVPENKNDILIKYNFQLKNVKKSFDIKMDRKTLNILLPERENTPIWVDLDFFKCANCPLDEKTNPTCPAAMSIIDVIEFFKKNVSFDEADIVVETEDRAFQKKTTLQDGISSLIGLCMAVSGCPIMGRLKPIMRYHRPFASSEELVVRAMATYLLGQYFRNIYGKTPDWDLKNLEKFYNKIHVVTLCFTDRLKNIHIHDASINALNIIDTFANFVRFEINKHVLKELGTSFMEYFEL